LPRRRSASRRASRAALAATVLSGGLLVTAPQAAQAGRERPLHLRSTPENVVWGGFPIDRPAVLTVKSGAVVRIDTISHQGATNVNVAPVDFFGALGVTPEEVLPDATAFWTSIPNRPRYGGHILTGPVYIEGAQPGDVIEVETLDLDPRVPFGINTTGPTSGVMGTGYPGWRAGDSPLDIPADIPPDKPFGIWPDVRHHLYRVGRERGKEVAHFNDRVKIPFEPFMGIMGVAPQDGTFVGSTPDAPPPATGVQGSGPPGPYGGNMDTHDIGVGSKLYLPVFQEGGQFFVGDPHGVQGDGEVSGNALEMSLSGTFRFTLHKGKAIDGPWAETDDHWLMLGIDWDLDRATRFANVKVVDFLVEEKGFTPSKAFSFASLAVDYHAAEVVDGTQVIVAKIPKDIVDPPRHGRR
jgi:acetamidase/formamidase